MSKINSQNHAALQLQLTQTTDYSRNNPTTKMLSSPQGSKTAAKDGSTPAASSSESKSDGNTLTNLPLKLHALLDEAEKLGKLDVVSWESNGKAFKVHDKKRFVAEIMPKYFSTSNYQSFQRYVLFLFAFAIVKNASWLLKLILLTVWIFSSQLLVQGTFGVVCLWMLAIASPSST